jgi:hypothetical protein
LGPKNIYLCVEDAVIHHSGTLNEHTPLPGFKAGLRLQPMTPDQPVRRGDDDE